MSTPPNTESVAVVPADEEPCAACPWRVSNQGKPHEGGWYTKKNLARLWGGLRRGARMSCHPTDPRMFPSATGPVKECAGALILQQREAMKAQESLKTDPSQKRFAFYRKLFPKGLTLLGLQHVFTRAMVQWPGEVKMTRCNLDADDVDYEPLGKWEKR